MLRGGSRVNILCICVHSSLPNCPHFVVASCTRTKTYFLLFFTAVCCLTQTFVLQMGNKEQSDGLNRAIDQMGRKTRDLRRQLRKAVVDHVSDR